MQATRSMSDPIMHINVTIHRSTHLNGKCGEDREEYLVRNEDGLRQLLKRHICLNNDELYYHTLYSQGSEVGFYWMGSGCIDKYWNRRVHVECTRILDEVINLVGKM
jgi:hypothetical protein